MFDSAFKHPGVCFDRWREGGIKALIFGKAKQYGWGTALSVELSCFRTQVGYSAYLPWIKQFRFALWLIIIETEATLLHVARQSRYLDETAAVYAQRLGHVTITPTHAAICPFSAARSSPCAVASHLR